MPVCMDLGEVQDVSKVPFCVSMGLTRYLGFSSESQAVFAAANWEKGPNPAEMGS